MKKLIFTLVFILSVSLCFSQTWVWAKQIGSTSADQGGVRIDMNNNIYCSGIFSGNCYFEHDTLHASGNNDIYFAKYDPSGNELWAKRIGGANPYDTYEYGGVATIDNGNNCLYFSGSFYNSLTIGSHTITSSGGADMFLAKFDLSGNCLWLKKAGSYGDDSDRALCLDINGNIYFSGLLANNGSFDNINLLRGSFLSKLDTNGNILWVRNEISGNGYISKLKIVNNEIVMAGVTANSDTTFIDTTILVSNHIATDGFLARLELNGNCIKAKRFKGHFPDFAGDFDLDYNNNIYLSGLFSDSLTIDATTLTNNNGNSDMFFCKFDYDFNLIWSKQSHSTSGYGAIADGVVKDSEGNFYISGFFSGNATFGIFNVNSSITKDFFVAKYDTNGACYGIIHFGEAEEASIATGSINIDNNGDLIVAGDFINTVNIGSTSLTSYGSSDMFFAKTSAIVGITEIKAAVSNQLLIYANPTTGKCTVSVPDDFLNAKNLMLSIFDSNGKLIQQKKLEMNEGRIKLDLEEEAKGIYNVTLSNGKKVYGGRIVFQ